MDYAFGRKSKINEMAFDPCSYMSTQKWLLYKADLPRAALRTRYLLLCKEHSYQPEPNTYSCPLLSREFLRSRTHLTT